MYASEAELVRALQWVRLTAEIEAALAGALLGESRMYADDAVLQVVHNPDAHSKIAQSFSKLVEMTMADFEAAFFDGVESDPDPDYPGRIFVRHDALKRPLWDSL